MTPDGDRRVVLTSPFPFPDGHFLVDLGAVVQRTVSKGSEPARMVVHDEDNGWLVGDGINDPNLDGACGITHMQHIAERDSSIEQLASLPVGYKAHRPGVDSPWTIERHVWAEES
jgi:hypothetical protein